MSKWNLVLVAVLMLFLPCLSVQADELADLQARVEKLEKGHAATNLDWSADFRYRHESVNKDNADHYDRDRIRARLKVVGKVNDSTKMTIRIATGENQGATSTNQTLGASSSSGDFSRPYIWLDQAFLTWTPGAVDGLTVLAGKMQNPFLRIGGNQLIWDSDLNPDGGAVQYSTTMDNLTIGGNAGGMWVRETHASSGAADTILLAGQLYGKLGIEEHTVTAGLSLYDFGGIQGLSIASEGNTNSSGNVITSTAAPLQNDYELFEVFLGLDSAINETPVSIFGAWVKNNGTVSSNNYDTAYIIGGKINKVKDPGSWQFAYDYRDVERDAVLGVFTDGDPFDGGTTDGSTGLGGTCHRFNFAYQLAKNITGAVTYWMSTMEMPSGTADVDYSKVQLDIILKTK